MLRKWYIPLAALAIALSPALAAGGASAATIATAAAPSSSASSALIASEAAHDAHASQPALTTANAGFSHACRAVLVVGRQSCFALKRDGVHAAAASVTPDAIPAGYGYGPSQLQSAYNLTSASASDGSGRTIALVDAYDDPTAASDLAAYRSAAGLPAVPSFEKVNQTGATSPLPAEAPADDDWTLEESLDLDMASAICPECKIVLVEATNDSGTGLYVAENTAAGLAGYVSNSWGGTETSTDTSYDSEYFSHSGVVITASAGDSDYGVIYPATSPNVVAVGGTSLSAASNARGWTESVWNDGGGEGTGSGCSAYEPEPSWQAALGLPSGCSKRIDNDTSADADPDTGLAVYDTSNGNGGWNEVGGTSASSPMLAAMYALGGSAGTSPADDIYTHTSDFYDVTSGSDGSCSPAYLCKAETGYDGPTGIGTPDGIAGLVAGSSGASTGEVHAVGAGQCLDDPGSTTTLGTQQQIWDCNSGANQIWTHNSSGELTLTPVSGTTLCLDASGQGTKAGTKVILWSCNGQTNQQWDLNSNGTITGVQSGLCLDVTGASTAEGALIEIWTCNGGSNQQWTGP
jgi:hypothetical protein